MVQILPQATNLGTQLGAALGQGIQRGSDIGLQRGLIQNALGELQNIPKGTTPFQLASKLISATAGIPGAERYVGQLFPYLLNQLQTQSAFGPQAGTGGSSLGIVETPQGAPLPGATAEEARGATQPAGAQAGGILGTIIPQDEIAARSQQYAQATGTGLQGATEMSAYLKGLNDTAEQQRKAAEIKAADQGISEAERPLFMQLGQRHKYAKTLDDWVRNTKRDFDEYKNLTKSLESVNYPGLLTGLAGGPEVRESQLKEVDNTVKRLVSLGFEQQVRNTLAAKGLSPTEVEERIHPFTPEQKKALKSFPSVGHLPSSGKKHEAEIHRLEDFLKKNINNQTSLLALRHRLWQDKNYNWHDIAEAMNNAIRDANIELTTAQANELGILEREPPRQSLSYIFRSPGNIFRGFREEK